MPIDSLNYIKSLEDFPKQCKSALELTRGLVIKGSINKIVVCGLGGSAIGGLILKSYLSKVKVPVHVVRDYDLPAFADASTLVFTVSYSGNTEETLSCYKQAVERGCVVWAITSGGRLSEIADNKVIIPSGLQPRAAVGFLFFPMVTLLYSSRVIDITNDELNEMISILKKVPDFKDKGNQIANVIKNRTPVIYSSTILEPAAYRMKCEFNENSKHPAFYHVFPEMNHNEIVGYPHMDRKNFTAIFIRDNFDNDRIKKRMDIIKGIIEKKVDVVEIQTQGKHFLSRIFSAIYLGDWASYYLAVYHREDPGPVDVIQDLKAKLIR